MSSFDECSNPDWFTNGRRGNIYSVASMQEEGISSVVYSPDEELNDTLETLIGLSQSAYRNNGWLSNGVDTLTSLHAGAWTLPKPRTGNQQLDISLRDLWTDFTYYAKAGTGGSVHTVFTEAVFSKLMSGDGMVGIERLTQQQANQKGLPVPLQFRNIDSAYCPADYSNDVGVSSQGKSQRPTANGVTIDSKGDITGYNFYPNGRNKLNRDTSDLVFVPVADIIHHYKPTRPSHVRGIPQIVKGIHRAVTFEQYNQAELTRKKLRSAFTGAIEKSQITSEDWQFDPINGTKLDYDHAGLPTADIEAGTFLNLLAGEKVNLFDTNDAGRGYASYQQWQLHAIASALGLPYQLLSGDFKDINDRLWRAIFDNMKRQVIQTQQNYMIPQLVRRVWVEFVNTSIASGLVKLPRSVSLFQALRATYITDPFAYIHPVQDIQSKLKQLDNGLISRSTLVDELPNSETDVVTLDNQRRFDDKSEEGIKPRGEFAVQQTSVPDAPVEPKSGVSNAPKSRESR